MLYVGLCLFIIVAFLAYMLKVAHENNVLTHVLSLQGEQEKMRLFFISDTHLRKINSAMLEQLKGSFDAIIIGGDFSDRRTPIARIRENIQLLCKLGPVYFVWGNNDHEVGEDTIRQLFAEHGVTVIENDAILLEGTKNRLWLSAIADTSTRKYSFEAAFDKVEKDDFVVFISHNPGVFARVREKYRADLMMGGHLHGGQIRLGSFGVHPNGSYKERDGVMTLVSNGYGTTLVPFRLGAKPQCHIIDINISAK
ncbi:MAG: metallophosphoesterase family protein [Lysinibacillus sp.]